LVIVYILANSCSRKVPTYSVMVVRVRVHPQKLKKKSIVFTSQKRISLSNLMFFFLIIIFFNK
jgi:hypothetical protein